MVESVSLSAPVTLQVREYIDSAIGVATLVSTLTVMGGSEKSTKCNRECYSSETPYTMGYNFRTPCTMGYNYHAMLNYNSK